MSAGILYIVATPLGNLEDMTFRAVRILKQADMIAAEDTRHSRKLLAHYGISTPMVSCHEYNEQEKSAQLTEHLNDGKTIALITDAGTPCISDPGFRLVSAAAAEDIRVIPVPGCSAAIAGLSVSGLPSDMFLFVGFLPKKQGQQINALKELENQKATLIFYESPRRILSLIHQIKHTLGDRNACLAREITKQHEEYIRGTLSRIIDCLEAKIQSLGQVKGECTLLVEGCREKSPGLTEEQLDGLIQDHLEQGHDEGTASLAGKISKQYAIPKKQVYAAILKLQNR